MKRAVARITGLLVALVAVGLLPSLFSGGPSMGEAVSGLAPESGVRGVRESFKRWSARHERAGGDEDVVVALGWSKGLSAGFSRARGEARLDLVRGRVQVMVDTAGEALSEVWLVDNRPGPARSVRPEPGDRVLRLGRLRGANGRAVLEAAPGPETFADLEVDLVVVTRSGGDPATDGMLFGAPTLFQRMYTESRRRGAQVLAGLQPRRQAPSLLARLGGSTVFAAVAGLDVAQLVAQGEDLFFHEAFAGNGRTCGTCHPARNNLTIDAAFIATLPPDDPLFVAEFTPALSQNFENPALMRKLGLILENQDGFDDLGSKFTMRGVPHILGMGTSLTPAPNGADGTTLPPNQRTGWSGDGAPGSGTLRDFAVGAVTQHFPRTLGRQPGVDFRLPTDEELNALEAFQLSLGRQQDLNLGTLVPRNALVRRGKEIFLASDTLGGTVAAGKCNVCHANAGATVAGGRNFNFDTGVEDLPDHPADFISPGRRPADGGFGTSPHPRIPGAFGNGTFNTPPLVESADTGPFFHNNAIETIEEAVAFYNSRSFNDSPSGRFLASTDTGRIGIRLEPTQVRAVAAFLRVLNALENIRSAIELQLAAQAGGPGAAELIEDSIAEIEDALEVLERARLHSDAVRLLQQARNLLQVACEPEGVPSFFLAEAIRKEEAARARMVQ